MSKKMGMIGEHFKDWLIEKGWNKNEAFDFSMEIECKVKEWQKEDSIIVLPGGCRCYHGPAWPSHSGQYDIIWCKTCQDHRDWFHSRPEKEEDKCQTKL